jgi:hypothetical protein
VAGRLTTAERHLKAIGVAGENAISVIEIGAFKLLLGLQKKGLLILQDLRKQPSARQPSLNNV